MNTNKILLVDTAFSSAPIYDYLKTVSDEVWVVGNRDDDILVKLANGNWLKGDYGDIEFVKSAIAEQQFNFVVPGCTDVSIDVCSRVGGYHLVDYASNNSQINNKVQFRKLCSDLDLPAPRLKHIEELQIGREYICKPVDSYSGRGINIFTKTADLDLFCLWNQAAKESPTKTALIEEYIKGDLYSFSAFVENNTVVDHFIVREGSSSNPYAVDTSYVDHNPDLVLVNHLVLGVEKIFNFLSLKDGLFHLQYILRDGMPYFIEATRRCPGDLYSLLIEHSTGFRYAAKFASYFTGRALATKKMRRDFVIRHTVSSLQECTYRGTRIHIPVNVLELVPLLRVGETMFAKQKSRAGILFLKNQDASERDDTFKNLMDRKVYSVF